MNSTSIASGLPVFGPADRIAVFLDFDGTLVDFADHPGAVHLDGETRRCIEHLHDSLSGALAIITGRDLEAIDTFLAPFRPPVAGVHGLVRRDGSGRVHETPVDRAALAWLAGRLDAFAAEHDGLLIERKPGAVALHYRQRPDLAETCSLGMCGAVNGLDGVTLLRGKSVIEARADGSDKGSAIEAFLGEAPFAGRMPVFAGDDVTDEDGFTRVNALGGVTIKVGSGTTCAHYRVPGVRAFRRWLCDTAARWQEGGSS